jgi:nucleoside-diphosphate-sugar epimerase
LRILVTGGAGFLGSVIVPNMLMQRADYRITVLDSFRFKQTSLAPWCDNPRLDIVKGDCRDERLMRELIARHDVFIPLAGIVGAAACDADREAAQSINCDAVEMLCDLLSVDQRVIFPNTNSGYGVGGEELCTEDSPLRPISVYGRTKCAAEAIVLSRENSVVFRLATVFGVSTRMRTDLLVNDFVLRALTERSITLYEPQARRNFIHIQDVARAFVHALILFGGMRGQVFNCGDSDANMTKAALCETIGRHVEGFAWAEGAGADPDKRDYIVSNAKLEAIGWTAQRTIDDGIRELLRYYRMSMERAGNA